MTIADLQQLLGDLAVFLESAKASATIKDLRAVREALSPFAGKTIKEFAGFLAHADELSRTGGGQPVAGGRAKPKASAQTAAAADPAELAIETKRLYDRATDPSVTIADIDMLAGKLSKLKKAGLVTVAEALGLKGMKGKTMPEICVEIRRMIEDRKGSHQRASMIDSPDVGQPDRETPPG